MITPLQSLTRIAELLERAISEPDLRDVRMLILQAHTIAIIRASRLKREEAREVFASYPDLEHGAMQ